jgi:hypothetical protein
MPALVVASAIHVGENDSGASKHEQENWQKVSKRTGNDVFMNKRTELDHNESRPRLSLSFCPIPGFKIKHGVQEHIGVEPVMHNAVPFPVILAKGTAIPPVSVKLTIGLEPKPSVRFMGEIVHGSL